METDFDTHTHTLGRFAVLNLNSHLKSFRKDRRSKTKRARKKDRSSEKSDYLALDYLALD